MNMKTVLSLSLALVFLAGTVLTASAVTDQEFSDLKVELLALTHRVHALESENAALRPGSGQPGKIEAQGRQPRYTKIKGDLRFQCMERE